MTNEQKLKIKDLIESGLSYGQISNKLGIPRSTISSFYKAHLEKDRTSSTADFHKCKNCGNPLEFTDGKRKKTFCSQSCRLSWWAKHPEMKNRKAIYSFTCKTCGSAFNSYGNSKRIYCSRKCYIQDRFKTGGFFHDSRTV